jgi:hypothetical protein
VHDLQSGRAVGPVLQRARPAYHPLPSLLALPCPVAELELGGEGGLEDPDNTLVLGLDDGEGLLEGWVSAGLRPEPPRPKGGGRAALQQPADSSAQKRGLCLA